MTARRSKDPAAGEPGRTGPAAAAYWTPARRREARPAQIRRVPPSESSPGSADGVQDDPEQPTTDPKESATSGDAPGLGSVEEGKGECGSDVEGSPEK